VLCIRDMPVSFPHQYSTSLSRTMASRARLEAPSRAGAQEPPAADPGASPEHMLLSSLGLSLLAAFEAFAARDGIEVRTWDAKVNGTVEQTPEGRMFTSIVFQLDLELAGNVDRAEDTLQDAKQSCLVLNSLRAPVMFETQLRTPPEAPGELSRPYEMWPVPPREPTMAQRRAS